VSPSPTRSTLMRTCRLSSAKELPRHLVPSDNFETSEVHGEAGSVDVPGIFRVRIAPRLEPIGRCWEDNHPVGESPPKMTSRDRSCSCSATTQRRKPTHRRRLHQPLKAERPPMHPRKASRSRLDAVSTHASTPGLVRRATSTRRRSQKALPRSTPISNSARWPNNWRPAETSPTPSRPNYPSPPEYQLDAPNIGISAKRACAYSDLCGAVWTLT
jgi:hypothetical protein